MAIQAGETTFYQAKRGIVQNGLVLNLDAAIDASYSGGTTWRDLEGNTNGTLTAGPVFKKNNGGSIAFDGTDDRVSLGTAANVYRGLFTANFWVKFSSFNTVLLGHVNTYAAYIASSSLVYIRNSQGFQSTSSFSLSTDTWENITVTRNYTDVKFYQNGGVVGSITMGDASQYLSTLGAYSNGGFALSGEVSIFNLYSRALTATEVLQNYNATRHRFGV